jgi:RNA polymerase sigma factor for flagellar operon FliA
LQRKPTEAELAAKLGVDIDRWRAMMLDPRIVVLVSASSRSNENDDQVTDFPGKPEAQPDSICEREQMRVVLEEVKKTLPERHQQVVALYYENEMTMTEIGERIGVNASRVSQIHKVALKKMMVRLRAKGIQSGY